MCVVHVIRTRYNASSGNSVCVCVDRRRDRVVRVLCLADSRGGRFASELGLQMSRKE